MPRGLEIDTVDGTSWVGVVPFRMEGVTRRPWPALPGLSAFPELNLRLYVVRDDRPGVWFLSLDAANRVAVWAARRWFHLPYHHAKMSIERKGKEIVYRSERRSDGRRFRARYAPTSRPQEARPGTLEHWLTERYCLYAERPDGTLLRADVHHRPWPLRRGEIAIEVNELARGHLDVAMEVPVLQHFADRLDVVVWAPERV